MGRSALRTVVGSLVAAVAVAVAAGAASGGGPAPAPAIERYGWEKVYDGPWPTSAAGGWTGRAGLQAVELGERLFVMGGRTPTPTPFDPFGSRLWNDVWASDDRGASWRRLATQPAGPEMWAERGYFQAVTLGERMFVLGGQDFSVAPNPACQLPPVVPAPVCPPFQPPFVPASRFFGDVWSSGDGVRWERLTERAPWEGRAGLGAIVFKGWIYVLGGGKGDDVAIGGSGRVLFDDVWRSRDGRTWEAVTRDAPWAARAGAAVVAKNGYLYLLGGENGFLCTFGPGVQSCPYFNDVWRSRDGAEWERVTAGAGWSGRPGHQCQVVMDTIVCFGGFGFPVGDPTAPAHPTDAWASRDGRSWERLPGAPWNAAGPGDVKYDFDSLAVGGGPGSRGPAIMTFGGDREASFAAPSAALVDDDVWRFSPSTAG